MRLGQAIPERPGTTLRRLIREAAPLIVPGCYNAMSARVLEAAGFPAIYMSGYGASLSLLGLPDAGLQTLTETAMNARYIAGAVKVPVIADADTGFGNAINVVRTVEEYIRSGLAGMHLEDQVAPKRCGHVAGREVVDRTEAVGKMRAAHATRQALDPEFVLIARTDSRGAHGGSLDEAIWRANALLDAGADLAFVEGPKDMGEVERIASAGGGADLQHRLVARDHLPPRDMAAALGRDLVLEVQAGDAAADVFLDGADDVDGVPEAGVGIGDERDADGRGDELRVQRHLGQRGQPGIGQAEQVQRGAVARHV